MGHYGEQKFKNATPPTNRNRKFSNFSSIFFSMVPQNYVWENVVLWKKNPIKSITKHRQRQAHSPPPPPIYNQLLSSRDTHTTQEARDDRELQTTEEGLKYRVESS